MTCNKSTGLKKWFIVGFLVVALCAMCSILYGFQKFDKTSVFAEESTKTYSYEVSNSQNGFNVVGYFENGQTYTLSNSAQSLTSVLLLISLDDTTNSGSIKFLNVNAGNDNLFFENVSYTVSGSIIFATISANPCISIASNSNIVFDNAEIKNNGTSTLIDVTNSSLSVQNQSALSSEAQTISASNVQNFKVLNSTITSKNSFAISGQDCIVSMKESTIRSDESSAVLLENSSFYTANCFFDAYKTNYAVLLSSTNATFGGFVKLNSSCDGIKTDMPINLDTVIVPCDEQNFFVVNIYYTGTIGNEDVLLVTNISSQLFSKFEVLNNGYVKRQIENSLYLAKQYRVFYNRNCADTSFTVPVDNNLYFNNDTVNIVGMEQDVRYGFIFLGWALTSDGGAYINQVTIRASNITVYAIFEPTDYTITYVCSGNIDTQTQAQLTNNNPTTYNFNQKTNLTTPSLPYYTFTGFSVAGDSATPLLSFSLPYQRYKDITIILNFALTEYQITYSGLTATEISQLGLTTSYNIKSESLNLASQSYLLKGQSFFGIYNKDNVDVSNITVNFNPETAQTFPNFVVGNTLNIVVKTYKYHNDVGRGTADFPYILNSNQQFIYLISGQKLDFNDKIYINFGNNIWLDNIQQQLSNTTLCNFVIDGMDKSIFVNSFVQYSSENSTILSIFPNLQNCTIKNLKFQNSLNSQVSVALNGLNSDTILACITPFLSSCVFENINVGTVLSINANFTTSLPYFYASGFAHKMSNSILNNCVFGGAISVQFDTAPNTSYVAGFCTQTENSLIVNSISSGSLSCKAQQTQSVSNKCFYVMGFGLLLDGNLISNSISTANLSCVLEQNDLCTLIGFSVATGKSNTLQNCYSNATYNQNILSGQNNARKNACVSTLWSVYSSFVLDGCVASENSNLIHLAIAGQNTQTGHNSLNVLSSLQIQNNQHITYLNKNLSSTKTSAKNFASSIMQNAPQNIEINKWYAQSAGQSNLFNKTFTLYVYSTLDKSVRQIVYPQNLGEIGILTTIYSGYVMSGVSLDKNGNSKISTINTTQGQDAFVYAHYQTYMQYVWSQSEWLIKIAGACFAILVLIILFAVLYSKKTVNFVFDGKVIFTTKVKKERAIPIPKDKQTIMWFTDKNGEKPFLSKKMPFVFKTLNLYSFSEETRIPLETAYLKKQAENCAKKSGLTLKDNKVKRLVGIENSQVAENNQVKNKKPKPKLNKVKANNAKQKSFVALATTEKVSKPVAKKSTQQQLKEEMEKVGVQIIKKEVVSLKNPDVKESQNSVKIDLTDAKDND